MAKNNKQLVSKFTSAPRLHCWSLCNSILLKKLFQAILQPLVFWLQDHLTPAHRGGGSLSCFLFEGELSEFFQPLYSLMYLLTYIKLNYREYGRLYLDHRSCCWLSKALGNRQCLRSKGMQGFIERVGVALGSPPLPPT